MAFPLLLPVLVLFSQAKGPAPAATKKPEASKVLATIDGVPVRASDIENLLWEWRSEEVLQDVMSLRLIEQAAQKAGIRATSAEIDERVREELTRMAAGGVNEKNLRDQGFPPSRVRLRIKAELLAEKITLARLVPSAWVRVSSLDFKPEQKLKATWASAISKATESYTRLKAGSTWEAETTTASGFGQQMPGGRWVQISTLPEALRPQVSKAAKNAILPPAQSEDSIEVIRMEALRIVGEPREDLKALKSSFLERQRGVVLAEIRNKAKIVRP